jgi:hypothetical protein
MTMTGQMSLFTQEMLVSFEWSDKDLTVAQTKKFDSNRLIDYERVNK